MIGCYLDDCMLVSTHVLRLRLRYLRPLLQNRQTNCISVPSRICIGLTFCCGVLVLLIFAHQIVHVRFSLREFLHRRMDLNCISLFKMPLTISSMPSPVYQCKKALRRNIAVNCSEIRLNSSWIAVLLPETHPSCMLAYFSFAQKLTDEGGRHLQATWWNVAHGCLHVVRDPFDEVRRVLVLHVQHLLVDLLHRHATTEDRSDGQISTVSRIARRHHVLRVEHLLRELGHCHSPVLLRSTRCQRREAGHEEVETRKGDHVHRQLSQIGVQLTYVQSLVTYSRC